MVASRRSRPPHSGQARTSIWNVRRRSSAHACEAEPYEMGLGRAITILPRAELGVLRAAHHRRSKCREQPSRRLPAFWLTRRSPGLVQPGRPPARMTLPDDERFSAATRSDVFAACRKRIVELDGEILSEIPTGEHN